MFNILLLFTVVTCTVGELRYTNLISIWNPSENHTFQVNETTEYILKFNISTLTDLPTVWVYSEDANVSAPLMIVARQPQEVLSWQLPLVVEGDLGEKSFRTTSRTLCYDLLKKKKATGLLKIKQDTLILTVSTVSNTNVSFTVNVRNEDFRIESSKEYNVTISPSEPRFFYYNFSSNITVRDADRDYKTVILEVDSDDDICMTVSIQNVSCPVFDTDQDVTFRGFYETVNRKGGITITKSNFPYGFYVVFVAKSDDFDCSRSRVIQPDSDRAKSISFVIKPSITYTDYVNAMVFTLVSIGAFYVFFGSAFFYCARKSHPRQMEYVQDNCQTNDNIPESRIVRTVTVPTQQGTEMTNVGTEDLVDSASIDESDYDVVTEIETDREMRLCRSQPYLTDLARKHPKVLRKKSYLYLYNVLTIAIFYGLPVVQLVIAYQKVLNETGQQDICYYNFLCAHPLGLISDFNHLFSNIGYVLFGILFLIITYHRERTHKDINFDRHFGIPQHYGLFYAMGIALIMEGILSGSYHVCPTQANFQFDSSFMYVMAVLCMVKLYHNRHPDINASSYVTFGVLAIAILLGMIGLFEATFYFWIFFVVLHVLTCFYLSIKVYYMGCWKISKSSMRHIFHIVIHDFWSGPINVLKPSYTARFVLLAIGNICNWGLSFGLLYLRPTNFAVFLLAVFMMNTILYFSFYIVMKYIHKERVRLVTWFFLLLSFISAITAMFFFFHKGISWSKSAAISRQFNKECVLFKFYDYHDIWHFLSSVGMFFTFMVLLTLDDDISHTHHSKIPVF